MKIKTIKNESMETLREFGKLRHIFDILLDIEIFYMNKNVDGGNLRQKPIKVIKTNNIYIFNILLLSIR